MSYPNLGNFAERLRCELCAKDWPPQPPDLSLPDGYRDPTWGDDPFEGWDDPPEQGESNIFDNVDVPGADLPGGGRVTPDWNDGPGLQFKWPW